LRRTSRLIVDGLRPNRTAMERTDWSARSRSPISTRSSSEKNRAPRPVSIVLTHVNAYGRFRLDMDTRIDLTGGQPAAESIL
jgi:hypothetical protein